MKKTPMPNEYVIDTHALVWFFAADERLSGTVRDLLLGAEENDLVILVPTIVMAEALTIVEKNKVMLTVRALVDAVKETERFTIVPLDLLVFERMLRITPRLELHDRAIAATCQIYGCPLLTKDALLTGVAETIW